MIYLKFGACSLELVCNLVLGICDFRHKTAKAELVSSDSRNAGVFNVKINGFSGVRASYSSVVSK